MFQKSLPLALVAIAGCVALTPTAQKPDTTQTAGPKSAPTSETAQNASPTPVPTPTPTPSPTPVPTPLPKSILKVIIPLPDLRVYHPEGPIYRGVFGSTGEIHKLGFSGVALSTSGDMYIQVSVPTDSIPVLCPACDMNISRVSFEGNYDPNYAVFKKTNIKNEFEFVAMSGKGIWGKNSLDPGKTAYVYGSQDFTFSKLTEAASVSVAPWAVKSVDVTKKEVSFDTSVWSQNTGSLKLSDVVSGNFFGRNRIDDFLNHQLLPWDSCSTPECENDLALTVVRERTAFTGTTAYFIGRDDTGSNTTIFRVSESGSKEIVGKNISAYLVESSTKAVHNFVYSRVDDKFYLFVGEYADFNLYRISENELVP